jgi:small GTP-binding protein
MNTSTVKGKIIPAEAYENFLDDTVKHLKKVPLLQPFYEEIEGLCTEIKKPLRVVITGEFKTGKSTLINTLLQEEILAADVTPKTAVVTEITYGETKTIIAHLKSGEKKNYDYSLLEDLSSEGSEDMKNLRDSIQWIELQYPNPLLKKLHIVDTPGLNAMHEEHTRATKEYLSRADMIWWIFHYSNIGRRTEMRFIENLESRIKKVAVINQIDKADDEEDFEDNIQFFKRKNAHIFEEVFPVSAKEAKEAFETKNEELMEWSNWEPFHTFIDREVARTASMEKYMQSYEKLKAILQKLEEKLSEQKDNKDSLMKSNKEIESQQKVVVSSLRYLKRTMEGLKAPGEKNISQFIAEMNYVPLQCREAERINNQKDALRKALEKLLEESKIWKKEYNQLRAQIAFHNNEFSTFRDRAVDYQDEGGDLHSKYEALEIEKDKLNGKAAELNEKSSALDYQNELNIKKIKRLEEESRELIVKIRSQLHDLYEIYEELSEKLGDETEKLKEVYRYESYVRFELHCRKPLQLSYQTFLREAAALPEGKKPDLPLLKQ